MVKSNHYKGNDIISNSFPFQFDFNTQKGGESEYQMAKFKKSKYSLVLRKNNRK